MRKNYQGPRIARQAYDALKIRGADRDIHVEFHGASGV
jgi:hypothetical protein